MSVGMYRDEEEYRNNMASAQKAKLIFMMSNQLEFDGYIERVIVALKGFMYARDRALHLVAQYFEIDVSIRQEILSQIQEARTILMRMPEQDVRDVQTRMLAGSMLKFQKHHIEKLSEQGILCNTDASRLEHSVDSAVQTLKDKVKVQRATAAALRLNAANLASLEMEIVREEGRGLGAS